MTVETLLRENIHGVFGEPDAEKRRHNIARLWLKTACLSIPNPVMKGTQVLLVRPKALSRGFLPSSLPSGPTFRPITASASSIGDSVPLERTPSSLASTCS